jgi:hypothetical protein
MDWRSEILKRLPYRISLDKNLEASLFTDSSSEGFGAILFTALGRTEILAGSWNARLVERHINEKEALCLLRALKVMDFSDVNNIVVWIDNTTALFSIRKGDSRSFPISRIVTRIWANPVWPKITRIEYINTKLNLADLPSRLQQNLHISSFNPFLHAAFMQAHE